MRLYTEIMVSMKFASLYKELIPKEEGARLVKEVI